MIQKDPSPYFFENPYGHDSKTYPKTAKGHDEMIPPSPPKKLWICLAKRVNWGGDKSPPRRKIL